jgi:uncharacterized membrane protein
MHREFIGIKFRLNSLHWLIYLAVGLLLFGWLLNTPPGLLGKADAVGYAVCHRIDLRSFHLGDRQVPLCARCTGMYLGAVLALSFQYFTGRRRSSAPTVGTMAVLMVFFLAFAIDGLNSFLSLIPNAPHLYEPQNDLRLLTGTGMGLVIGAALYPGFNQTVWANADPRPALDGWKKLCALIVCALALDLVVFSENPLLLYPLALLSAVGVLVILTMVYCMLWIIVMRSENRYLNFKQLAFPLVGGFGLALLQIALLDYGRFLLTGTWEGFHLG